MNLHLIKSWSIPVLDSGCWIDAGQPLAGSVVDASVEVAPQRLRVVLVSDEMEPGKAASGLLSRLGKGFLKLCTGTLMAVWCWAPVVGVAEVLK